MKGIKNFILNKNVSCEMNFQGFIEIYLRRVGIELKPLLLEF